MGTDDIKKSLISNTSIDAPELDQLIETSKERMERHIRMDIAYLVSAWFQMSWEDFNKEFELIYVPARTKLAYDSPFIGPQDIRVEYTGGWKIKKREVTNGSDTPA